MPEANDLGIISEAEAVDDLFAVAPPADEDTEPTPRSEPGALTIPLEFDPRYRQDFDGLLYLGALNDEFIWSGHRFVIRTLTVGELLEIGNIVKRYAGSMGEGRAYTAAVCAACLVSLDGKPIVPSISREHESTALIDRFRYISENWYPWTVDAVYARYAVLEARAGEVIERVGEASGRTD